MDMTFGERRDCNAIVLVHCLSLIDGVYVCTNFVHNIRVSSSLEQQTDNLHMTSAGGQVESSFSSLWTYR